MGLILHDPKVVGSPTSPLNTRTSKTTCSYNTIPDSYSKAQTRFVGRRAKLEDQFAAYLV